MKFSEFVFLDPLFLAKIIAKKRMETTIARGGPGDCLQAGEQKLTQYESLGLSKGLEVPVGGTPYSPSPHLGGFERFPRLPPFFLYLYCDLVFS